MSEFFVPLYLILSLYSSDKEVMIHMSSVFEEKNIPKAVLQVGMPAMLGQLTTLVYNLADTWFVSMTKEPDMIAAVTLSAPILLIIMSIAAVFGSGGSSMIARLMGEEKSGDAGSVMNFCTYTMGVSGAVVLILGLFWLNPVARLAGAEAANIGCTCDYLRYIFWGAPFIMLSNGFVALFRSVGKIKESTIGLVLGNVINVILDYIFILPLGMGTAGAALATSLGFACSTVYFLACMVQEERRKDSLFHLSPKYFHPNVKMVRDVVSIGIPGALITILMSVSNIVLNNYIAIYGSDAVASYGIAYKIDMVPVMLSVGLSQGVAPLIGFHYGAGEKRRMSDVMKWSVLYGVLMGAAFTVLFLFMENQLSAVFLHEENLIRQTGYFLKILCLSAPMLGVINMVTSYFQALGKAAQSLLITLLRNVALFIPAVIILNMVYGLNGVIAAQPVVETVMAIICMVLYAVQKSSGKEEKKEAP